MDSINPINILAPIPYNDTYLDNVITPDTNFYCIEEGGGLYVYSFKFHSNYDFLLCTVNGLGHHGYGFSDVGFNLKKGSVKKVDWSCWINTGEHPVYNGIFLLFDVSRGDTLTVSSQDGNTYFKFFIIE